MATLLLLSQAVSTVALAWLLSIFFDRLHSALCGQVLAGMLLQLWLRANSVAQAVHVAGHLGLMLLVFRGALTIRVHQLRAVGLRAVAVGTTGTILPLLFGYALLLLFGHPHLPALVSGTALSSTAIGMAVQMLQHENVLDTPLGSLISSAAIIDDVLSLIILAVVSTLVDVSLDPATLPWRIAQPILVSALTILFGVFAARHLATLYTRFQLSHSRPSSVTPSPGSKPSSPTTTPAPPFLLPASLAFAAALALASLAAGTTHLLGVFAAGVALSEIPAVVTLFDQHAQPVVHWLVAMFFVAIGLQVPIASLFATHALLLGLLNTLVAIVSKMLSGLWAPPGQRLPVSCAVVGRGELGFLMISEAFRLRLVDAFHVSVTVWALLLATLAAPAMLNRALKHTHD